MNADLSVIDGSVLEGGGQILRVAVACAAIIKKPIQVEKIRAGRPNPGLSNQHLTGIRLAAQVCGGQLSTCDLGSTILQFTPHYIRPGDYEADAKTAGSISLLLQIAIPILAYSGGNRTSTLKLKGGTDAKFAPPIDYIKEITNHYFSMLGLRCDLRVIRRGFYPQGGGLVHATIQGLERTLIPINLLEAGALSRITGYAFVAGRVPIKVAHEMKKEFVSFCTSAFPSVRVDIDVFREDDQRCIGNVSAFLIIAHTKNDCKLAVSGLGDPRGPHHTQLVREAVGKLSDFVTIGACCDDHMQDQLILPMALADGRSTIRTGPLTSHTKTAIYVIESLLQVKFSTVQEENGSVILSCRGIKRSPQQNM